MDGFRLNSETRDPTGPRAYSGLQEGPQSASIPAYLADQTVGVIRKFSKTRDSFYVSCNFWGPHAPYYIIKKIDRKKLSQARERLLAWMMENNDPFLFWAKPMLEG